MSIQITYHGHACFSIQTGAANLLIDPFLTGNAMADVTPEQVTPDYILVTHAHGDHLGDALPIAKRTGATVISNNEIHSYMTKHGVKSHGMHIGGAHVFPFGKVKLTIAHHGSSFPDGSYGGTPCGFLLWVEDKVLYHAGDTAAVPRHAALRRGRDRRRRCCPSATTSPWGRRMRSKRYASYSQRRPF